MSKDVNLLELGAKRIIKQLVKVRRNENVLIITDQEHQPLYEALSSVCMDVEASASVFVVPENVRPLSHIPQPLKRAIFASDVVLSILHKYPRETPFRAAIIQIARSSNARVAHMPGLPLSVFDEGLFEVNYADVAANTLKLQNILNSVDEIRVTSAMGTDLLFKPSRIIKANTGFAAEPGCVANLPGGEVYLQPDFNSMNGVLIVDGLIDGGKPLSDPVTFEIEAGKVVDIHGSDIDFVKQAMAEDANVKFVSEFGIGTNPGLGFCSTALLAEKAKGIVHFALGASSYFGGTVIAKRHIPLILKSANVTFDGRAVVEDGTYLVD